MAHRRTLPLIYLTSFFFLFGESIQPSPRIAIYESVACRQYYDARGSNVADCKIAAVQEELSLLIGMERLSIIIPSILAIPFAALADRVGHRTILSVAIFGVLLEDLFPLVITWFEDIFPLRLIWLHFIFSLVGGGFTVVVTLLHVIIAQIVNEEQRTAVFFRIRAAGVAASVLGYAASGLLMKWNNWLPWIVGLISLAVATVTARLVPVTKANECVAESGRDDTQSGQNQRSRIQIFKKNFDHVLKVLGGNRHLLVMLVLVFLCQLGFDAVPLMLAIYISQRFGWTFADASFLNSIEMFIEFLTVVIILPCLAAYLPSSFQSLRSFNKERYLAQWSIAALSIGGLFLGFAPTVHLAIAGVIILALGTGQDSLLRSMATELAPKSDTSIVYSAVTMLRAIGGSVSGPLYAQLYSTGLKSDSSGLPFMVSAALFAIALGLCITVSDGKTDKEDKGSVAEREETEPLLGRYST